MQKTIERKISSVVSKLSAQGTSAIHSENEGKAVMEDLIKTSVQTILSIASPELSQKIVRQIQTNEAIQIHSSRKLSIDDVHFSGSNSDPR